MRKKKHLILLWILSLVLLSTAAVPVFAEAELPKTDCEAAILIDAQSGRVLYEKDADRAVQPASLTKMMTALLVVESMNLDDTVTITTEAASIGGNAIQLKEGEQLTVRQLLNALLVYSANDAAVALGMNHTHYLSPNGLIESEKHITTARDISIITRKVLQNQELAAIVKKTRYTVPATNKGRPRPRRPDRKSVV